ncbi:MAG: hypothetical protein WDN31_06925 [Hyphomicrobium sp.]
MPPKFPAEMHTPAYVLDVKALKRNLETVARIRREAGCKVLLATKAWRCRRPFPLMRDALDGSTASGEFEARLGREEFGKEVHVYAPAYSPGEVERPHGPMPITSISTRRSRSAAMAASPRRPAPSSVCASTQAIRTRPSAALFMIRARPARALAPRRRRSTNCRGARSTCFTFTRCARAWRMAPPGSSRTWRARSRPTSARSRR